MNGRETVFFAKFLALIGSCKCANLQDANLQDANLQGANLQGANLQGANLRGAGFQGAGFQGANLQGADLRDVDLRDVDLRGADLQVADLRGADLQGANIDFSCLPLWCGSTVIILDTKQKRQLMAHALHLAQDEFPGDLTQDQKDWLNDFHRIRSKEFPKFK